MKDIIWLENIKKEDIARVGGKGANLGELTRGLSVPPGFCLTSAAYFDNLNHYGLMDKIKNLLETHKEERELEAASEKITGLIMEMPLLTQVEQGLKESYAKLAKGDLSFKVAVRSSATAEDLADASFAGQQDTYLNVASPEDLLQSVKKCWASLWSPRVIFYRNLKGFDHFQVKMAVIIQEMVPADYSGVMFTANPVNNRRDQIRIETVRGLGEKLVSGEEAGDVYLLTKSENNVALVSKEAANAERGQLLSDFAIRELAHNGLQVEKYYGYPQDIEWTYYQGKFYFLQSRPITTLAEEELPVTDLKQLTEMEKEVMEWVAERFPEPIYPIDGIIVKILFMAQFEAMGAYGFKVSEVDWTEVEKGIFPEFFKPPAIRGGLKRIYLYLRLGKTLKSDPAAEWASEQKYLLGMLDKLKKREVSTLPLELIVEYITEALNHLHYFIVMRYKYFTQNRIPASVLKKFLMMAFGKEGQKVYEDLLAGSHNVTLDINNALVELAESAQAKKEVQALLSKAFPRDIYHKLDEVEGGIQFKEQFDRFLMLYGDRETKLGLGGIASPAWRDTPEVVFGILKGMLQDDLHKAHQREIDRIARAKEAEDKVKKYYSGGLFTVLGIKRQVYKMIRHARSFVAFRENSHFDVTRSLQVFRILFNELGKRFVRRGILQDSADIFYLSYFEVKNITETLYNGLEELDTRAMANTIRQRKEERIKRKKRWSMRGRVEKIEGTAKGIPASSGIATGPVRIIREPGDFHLLEKGDIIVAPYTNPAWTPLFATAAALVAETGGASSHAAIIAREYGIPAVMGVRGATELFSDGEYVTVDGSSGSIAREQ